MNNNSGRGIQSSRVGSRPVSNHGNMRDLQPEDLKGNEASQALNHQLKLNYYHC